MEVEADDGGNSKASSLSSSGLCVVGDDVIRISVIVVTLASRMLPAHGKRYRSRTRSGRVKQSLLKPSNHHPHLDFATPDRKGTLLSARDPSDL